MGKYPGHKISEIEELPCTEVRKRLLKRKQEEGLDVWAGLFFAAPRYCSQRKVIHKLFLNLSEFTGLSEAFKTPKTSPYIHIALVGS